MASAGRGEFGMEVIPEYGLFPRGMIEVFMRLEAMRRSDTDVRYVMTVSAVELALEGNLDLFNKSAITRKSNASEFGASDPGINGVSLDRTCSPPRLYGMTELPLNAPEDVLRTFEALASRNTAGTTMNDSSSRSHCFVFLNLYAYQNNAVRASRFQFCDMAGSERLSEAHGGETNVHKGTVGMTQGLAVNYSL